MHFYMRKPQFQVVSKDTSYVLWMQKKSFLFRVSIQHFTIGTVHTSLLIHFKWFSFKYTGYLKALETCKDSFNFATIMHNSQNYLVPEWFACLRFVTFFCYQKHILFSLGQLIIYSVQLWIQWLLIVLLQKRFAEINTIEDLYKSILWKMSCHLLLMTEVNLSETVLSLANNRI